MTVRSSLKSLIAQRNAIRRELGQVPLTLRQIAADTGLALSVVNGLTSGRSERVDFKTLSRLCAYFQVQPGEFLVYEPGEAE